MHVIVCAALNRNESHFWTHTFHLYKRMSDRDSNQFNLPGSGSWDFCTARVYFSFHCPFFLIFLTKKKWPRNEKHTALHHSPTSSIANNNKNQKNKYGKKETNKSELIESECEVRCYNCFDSQIGFCVQFPKKKRWNTEYSEGAAIKIDSYRIELCKQTTSSGNRNVEIRFVKSSSDFAQ